MYPSERARFIRRWGLLLAACLLAAPAVLAALSPTSGWPMFGGNKQHTALSASQVVNTQPGVDWAVALGSPIAGTPALSDDNNSVIVGTADGRLLWLDTGTGAITRTMSAQGKTPFRGTPLIGDDGTVFAANADGRVYVHPAAGADWFAPAGARPWGPLLTSPFFVSIGAGTDNYVAVTSTDGKLYLIDPATKATAVWFGPVGGSIETNPALGAKKAAGANTTVAAPIGLYGTSAVLVDTTNVYPGDGIVIDGVSRGYITRVDYTAKTVYFTVSTSTNVVVGAVVTTVPHAPLVFGGTDGQIYCINGDESPSHLRWTYPGVPNRARAFTGSPMIVGDHAFIGDAGGTFYAINIYTGLVAGTFTDAAITGALTTPAEKKGGGEAYVGFAGNGLAAIDISAPATMTLVRNYTLPTAVRAQPVVGNAGRILVGGDDGVVYSLDHTANGIDWSWPSGHPAGMAGSVLIIDNNTVLAVTRDGCVICLKRNSAGAAPAPGPAVRGPWAQHSAAATHPGALNGEKHEFTIPTALGGAAYDGNNLRWTTKTGGPVRSSASVLRNSDIVRAAVLATAIPAPFTGTRGSTRLSVTSAASLNVGDQLVIDDDYLGPITAITRVAGGPDTVVVTYGPAKAHAANATVRTSLYRMDAIREGEVVNYGSHTITLPRLKQDGDFWYDASPYFNPGRNTVALRAIIKPRFVSTNRINITGNVSDGETVKVGGVTFEFDTNTSKAVGSVRVNVQASQSAAAAALALAGAFNSEGLDATVVGASSILVALPNSDFSPTPIATSTTCANAAWELAAINSDGDQVVQFGFMEKDAGVINPANAASPVYLYAYLTDDGRLSIRRNISGADPYTPAPAVLVLPANVTLSMGIELVLAIRPRNAAGGMSASAQVFYRLPNSEGKFPDDFTGFTAGPIYTTLPTHQTTVNPTPPPPAIDIDPVLPTLLYPYAHGQDMGQAPVPHLPGFTAEIAETQVYISYNPVTDTDVIGPGNNSLEINHPEIFLPGDTIELVHPTDPLRHETLQVTSVSGRTLRLKSPPVYYYPPETTVRAGQPGQWAAVVGSDDGILRSLDPESGYARWANSAKGYLGAVRGTPALDAARARIYVAGTHGRLFAFAQNGQLLWAYPALDAPALSAISTAPVLDEDGNVYFATDGGYIYKVTPDGALAIGAGNVIGIYPRSPDPALQPIVGGLALYRAGATTAPADLRVIVAVQNGQVISLDGNLTKKWVYPNDLGGASMNPVTGGPIVGSDGTIYIADNGDGAVNGKVHAIYENGGVLTARWPAFTLPFPVRGTGAVSEDKVYFADRANVYAIDTATGAVRTASSAVAWSNGPITLDASGNVLAVTDGGGVFAFAPITAGGQLPLWPWFAPAGGAPLRTAPALWQGNLVIVGSDDGNIYGIGTRGVNVPATPNYTQNATGGFWPKIFGDPRNQSSAARAAGANTYVTVDPGPALPNLRWFAAHAHRLSASALVTDYTPDRHTRTYQGTNDSEIIAYDASTGLRLWSKLLDGDGPVRATPAVHSDGTLAVSSLDGRVYLLAPDGTVLWDTYNANTAPAKTLFGTFLAAPARAGNGMVLASTAGTLDTGGDFSAPTGNPSPVASAAMLNNLCDGDNATAVTGDAALELIYDLKRTATVGRIRIRTLNGGELYIERDGSWHLVNAYPEALLERYVTADVNAIGTRVKWTNRSAAGVSVQAFEVYTIDGDQVTAAYTVDGANVPAVPLTGDVIHITPTAGPTYLQRVEITTKSAGTLRVRTPDGQTTALRTFLASGAAATTAVPVDRVVSMLIWDNAAGVQSTLDDVKLYGAGGGFLYGFDAATGAKTWAYPAAGRGFGPFVGNAILLPSGSGTAVAATTAGQVLKLHSTMLAAPVVDWSIQLPAPVVAAPVFVDTDPPGNPDVFLVTTSDGKVYTLDYGTGAIVNSWTLPGPCTNTPVVARRFSTGERWAYFVTDRGQLARINVRAAAAQYNPMTLGLVPAAVKSSPVIDSVGRLYVGSEMGAAFCLDTDGIYFDSFSQANYIPELWSFFPERNVVSTALAMDVLPGEHTLPVTSVDGFVVGDTVAITRSDGGQPEPLGQVTSLQPQKSHTTFIGVGGKGTNETAAPRDIVCTSDVSIWPAGVTVGTKCFLIGDPDTVYTVTAINAATKTITVDRDIPDVHPVAVAWGFLTTPVITPGQLTLSVTSVDVNSDGIVDFRAGDDVSMMPLFDPEKNAPPVLRRLGKVVKADLLTSTIVLDTPLEKMGVTGLASNDANSNAIDFTFAGAVPAGVAAGVQCYITREPDKVYTVLAVAGLVVTLNDVVPMAHPKNDVAGQAGAEIEWTFETKTVNYPGGSQVFVGQVYSYMSVSRAPSNTRLASDVIRAIRGSAPPMRTSPSIGPGQVAYIGAEDGLLYALGPIGPAGTPPALPPLPVVDDLSPWYTFHHDNQRTGYAPRPGPLTKDLRWYLDTGSTLEASPVIGQIDAEALMGVVYAGTADELDTTVDTATGVRQSRLRGSLLSVDASTGLLRWRFNDDKLMGRILATPAVFSHERILADGQTLKDELIVTATVDLPEYFTSPLAGALIIDANGVEVPVTDLVPGDEIVALLVLNGASFRAGMDVYITEANSGANYEGFGIIAGVNGNTLRLAEPVLVARAHAVGSDVHSQSTQQGHLYCVDRAGKLRWKFPPTGALPSELIGPIHSSPVVDKLGNSYFGTDDGVLYCVDVDGNLAWSYVVPREIIGQATNNTVVNKRLLTFPKGVPQGLRVGQKCYPSDDPTNFYAIAAIDTVAKTVTLDRDLPQSHYDAINWFFADDTNTTLEITSSPMLNKEQTSLFVGVSVPDANRGYLIALDIAAQDESRRLLWKRLLYTDLNKNGQYDPNEPGPVTGSPMMSTVGGKDLLYVATDDLDNTDKDAADPDNVDGLSGSLFCIDPATGEDAVDPTVAVAAPPTIGPKRMKPVCSAAAAVPESSSTTWGVSAVAADGSTITVHDVALGRATNLLNSAILTFPAGVPKGLALNQVLYPYDEPSSFYLVRAIDQATKSVTLDKPLTTAHATPVNWYDKDATFAPFANMRVKIRTLTSTVERKVANVTVQKDDAAGENRYVLTMDIALDTTLTYQSVRSNEQMIVVGALDGNIYAYTEKLVPLWRFPAGGPIRTSPAISREVGQVGPRQRSYSVYTGSNDHFLTALTTYGDTAVLRWERDMRDRIYGSPVVGATTSSESWSRAIVYLASRDHYLYAFGDQTNMDVDNPPDPDPPLPPHEVIEDKTDPLVPSTVMVQKAVDLDAADALRWKFVITVRNVGRGLVDKINLFDMMPDKLTMPYDGTKNTIPDILPARTGEVVDPNPTQLAPGQWEVHVAGPNATDYKVILTNRGTNAAPQWELQFTTMDGVGFKLIPDKGDPLQVAEEYKRLFAFAARIKQTDDTRTYENMGTAFVVTKNPAVIASANIIKSEEVPRILLGDSVFLQLAKHPIPATLGGSVGLNQITVQAQTYKDALANVEKFQVHKETPVTNDWTDTFVVRLYYNGFKGANNRLVPSGGESRSFSPRNASDPDTGEPLVFTMQLQMKANGTAVGARRMRTFPGGDKDNPYATSGLQIPLSPSGRRFDLRRNLHEVVKDYIPNAWRATIQQGRAQVNQQIAQWGPETNYSQRVVVGVITGGATIPATDRVARFQASEAKAKQLSRMKGHTLLFVNADGTFCEPYVTDVGYTSLGGGGGETTFYFARPVGIDLKLDATLYDEWSADFTITNPVSVTGISGDLLALGNASEPGTILTSDPVTVTNSSALSVPTPTYPMFRYRVVPIDMRVPGSGERWNDWLDLSAGYDYGSKPLAGAVWDGFRYDPYREYTLSVTDANLDLPTGTALSSRSSLTLHVTRPVPAHQMTGTYGKNTPLTVAPTQDTDSTYESRPRHEYDPVLNINYINVSRHLDVAYHKGLDLRLRDTNGNGTYDAGAKDANKEFYFLDFDLDGAYTTMVDLVLDDVNGNGEWDNGGSLKNAGNPLLFDQLPIERLYLDRDDNGMLGLGEPSMTLAQYDMRIYLDMNGNSMYDEGEPFYPGSANRDEYTTDDSVAPRPISQSVSVAATTSLKMPSTVHDLGGGQLTSGYSLPSRMPEVLNTGNQVLDNMKVMTGSTVALVTNDPVAGISVTPGYPIQHYLMRAGMPGVLFDAVGSVNDRSVAETQGMFYYLKLPSDWKVLKGAAGDLRETGRPFETPLFPPYSDLVKPITGGEVPAHYRLPSGTYYGEMTVSNGPLAKDSTVVSARVRETVLSDMVGDPRTPPPFDFASTAAVPPLANAGWTSYLSGIERWPTAVVLPADTTKGRDDPAVFVSSNTPIPFGPVANLQQLLPTTQTDTTLWYRHVKHLLVELEIDDIDPVNNRVVIPKEVAEQIRAISFIKPPAAPVATANGYTADLLMLQPKATLDDRLLTAPSYGQAAAVIDDTGPTGTGNWYVSIAPAANFTWPYLAPPNSDPVWVTVAATSNQVDVSTAAPLKVGQYIRIDNPTQADVYCRITAIPDGSHIIVNQIVVVEAAAQVLVAVPAVLDIFAHPWVPVVSAADLFAMRTLLDDPGAPGYMPRPVECLSPSVTLYHDATINKDLPLLVWSVSALRRITTNGQASYGTQSFLAYKQFNQDDPSQNGFYWITPPNQTVRNLQGTTLALREKPQLLTNLTRSGLWMVLYEGAGTGGLRGLYYSYGLNTRLAQTTAASNTIQVTVNSTVPLKANLRIRIDNPIQRDVYAAITKIVDATHIEIEKAAVVEAGALVTATPQVAPIATLTALTNTGTPLVPVYECDVTTTVSMTPGMTLLFDNPTRAPSFAHVDKVLSTTRIRLKEPLPLAKLPELNAVIKTTEVLATVQPPVAPALPAVLSTLTVDWSANIAKGQTLFVDNPTADPNDDKMVTVLDVSGPNTIVVSPAIQVWEDAQLKPYWTNDTGLWPINRTFTSVGAVQPYVDSRNGIAEAQPGVMNLVFQGTTGGNTDLYYARARIDQAANSPLTLLPLITPAADAAAGKVETTVALTRADSSSALGTFVTPEKDKGYRAWWLSIDRKKLMPSRLQLHVKTPANADFEVGMESWVDLPSDIEQNAQYQGELHDSLGNLDPVRDYVLEFTITDAAGLNPQRYRVSFDPYAGSVRVLRGADIQAITLVGMPRLQRLTTHAAPDVLPNLSVERWRYRLGLGAQYGVNARYDVDKNDFLLKSSPRLWLFWTRQHDDGLGPREYYRTWLSANPTVATVDLMAPALTRTDVLIPVKDSMNLRPGMTVLIDNPNLPDVVETIASIPAGTSVTFVNTVTVEVGAVLRLQKRLEEEMRTTTNPLNVDMPERMLPLEVLTPDGTAFATRLTSTGGASPESGLWVLTTASRDPSHWYDLPTHAKDPRTTHDLYLQVLDVPVPDR